jgi:trans-AT polyketide synthase/acyltransferase/oxidoreductase domain-containing protein
MPEQCVRIAERTCVSKPAAVLVRQYDEPLWKITSESLGSRDFRADYRIKYAYLVGSMYKAIASAQMVVELGRAHLMGYLGTGGLSFQKMEAAIRYIQSELSDGQSYGMNLLHNFDHPDIEERTADLFLACGIRYVEAAAFMQVTPSLARLRLTGIRRTPDGAIKRATHVLAKVSRPEVARAFMQPTPAEILRRLVESRQISVEEAELGSLVPVADEICVEADSGGHTDQRVAYTVMPAMIALRDELMAKYRYGSPIRVGAAGGIGTPDAAAAAFILGADFIVTGSINQCTVEAGTSDIVKDMLQEAGVQDTAYAPAGDMFELGTRVQVLKRGSFFPARAAKLYELYQRHNSVDEIDEKNKQQIQEKYFQRSFDVVWDETRAYYERTSPKDIEGIEDNPRKKMALIFKWYFVHTTRQAMQGDLGDRVNYQIHCGPAMGAFNQWVKGTELENWRNRRVADLAERIMQQTAVLLNQRFASLIANVNGNAEQDR